MLQNNQEFGKRSSLFQPWRIASLIIDAVLLVLVVVSVLYIHQAVFKTLEGVDSISNLQQSPALSSINQAQFDQASAVISLKNSIALPSTTLRMIFIPSPTSSPAN